MKNPKNNLEETVAEFAQIAKGCNIPLTCFYETRPSVALNGVLPNQVFSLVPAWLACWIPYEERIVRLIPFLGTFSANFAVTQLAPSDSASLHTFPSFALHVKHALLKKFS